MDEVSISRKAHAHICSLPKDERLYWQRALRRFIRLLKQTSFGGIALDYDGTVCDLNKRLTGIHQDVANELIRLMENGILVGIATGRGDSARDTLAKAIPKRLWDRIIVGYHNGSELGRLNELNTERGHPLPHFAAFRAEIEGHRTLWNEDVAKDDRDLQGLVIAANLQESVAIANTGDVSGAAVHHLRDGEGFDSGKHLRAPEPIDAKRIFEIGDLIGSSLLDFGCDLAAGTIEHPTSINGTS